MQFRTLGPLEVAEQARPSTSAGGDAAPLLAIVLLHATVVFVRSGPCPGGSEPVDTRTRVTWSMSGVA